jgi:anti-repressor protein
MENALQVFSNQEFGDIRVVMREGEPWFVAADVCTAFRESNRYRAMQSLHDDEKGYTQMNTPGGLQQVVIVNEAGLYTLLFAMRPAKARGVSDTHIAERQEKLKAYKRWVTHEVLPTIRKHGAYITTSKLEEMLNDPDAWIGMLNAIKEERSAKERLQLEAEQNLPKVRFADAVSASNDTILIGELAKILKGNGVDVGQNRLFTFLRNAGYLIKRQGTDYNTPTQRAMDLGLFRVKESIFTHSDGLISIKKTTMVTGKGQHYFINLFMGSRSNRSALSLA